MSGRVPIALIYVESLTNGRLLRPVGRLELSDFTCCSMRYLTKSLHVRRSEFKAPRISFLSICNRPSDGEGRAWRLRRSDESGSTYLKRGRGLAPLGGEIAASL